MDEVKTTEKSWTLLDGLRVDRALVIVWEAARNWTVLSIVLALMQAILPLGTLYILKLITDSLTNEGVDAALADGFQKLLLLIGLAFILGMVGSLCRALSTYVTTIQSHLVADQMQRRVQAKSIELDLEYYENSQFYDKLHRAQREAPTRPLKIVQDLTSLTRNGLTLIGAFVVLLTFHWSVVLVVFAAAIPVLFYRLKQADDVYQLNRDKTINDRLSAYFNRVITTVDDAKEVRVFGFGPKMSDRFRDLRNNIRAALRQISARGARREFFTETASVLVGYGALVFIVRAAVQQTITLGELLLYFGAFQIAVGALRPTMSGLGNLYENNLFLSTLYEFLAVRKMVTDPSTPRPMPRSWQSGLLVENLTFRYPGTDHLVLDGVDMCIQPGETVALVGRNGSGKTTLTKLLCRLYDPSAGSISVDGIDVREYKTSELRREIGVIYQDFGRYQVTARENIQLGQPEFDANDEAIYEAARWAGIHDDLMRLPKGYDTVLSRNFDGGEELSIGQWQKLSLARALLRDSNLILLDEPTSSLDPAAEFEFFEMFRSMVRDRSALIISHRFSTVRLADRIYVLKDGRMIEEGNHEKLMELDGYYAGLYNKQASYYQEVDVPTKQQPRKPRQRR